VRRAVSRERYKDWERFAAADDAAAAGGGAGAAAAPRFLDEDERYRRDPEVRWWDSPSDGPSLNLSRRDRTRRRNRSHSI